MLVLVSTAILVTSIVFEALSFLRVVQQTRSKHILLILAVATNAISIVFMFFVTWQFAFLLLFVSLYRFINIAKNITGRLPELHLRSVTWQSFVVLATLQLLVLCGIYVQQLNLMQVSVQDISIGVVMLSLLSAVVILYASVANILRSKPVATRVLADSDLPTLTVAIAARNETPMLVDCLNSVVASDYPKLEVLVFDDNSQDTTAEIIKSFAQNGVRFIGWEHTPGDWLSKNRAYQTLLEHASGDYVFFMGVDVRLETSSLRKITEQILARNVSMIGLVPKRIKSGLLAISIQPMRYWWEIALPNRYKKRPPVLSTAWIAHRAALMQLGGFLSYKRSIIPEEHLARKFFKQSSYAFARTSPTLQLTTQKNFMSQWDTQVRTRYPHAHRRPETVLLQSLLLLVITWPFIALPLVLLGHAEQSIVILVCTSITLLITSHIFINSITNPIANWFAPFNFPIAIALDILALHVSMYRYEFAKVIWKGRDVAPKKLVVYNELPAL